MDAALVVDASVWVSRLVPQDINHGASRVWLERYLASGGLLVCPALVLSEVAGAVVRRSGRGAEASQAVHHLLAIAQLQLVSVDQVLGLAAAQAAAELRLRGGDAVYVAVAHSLNISLVTWDDEQLQRARPRVVTYTPDSYVF